MNKTEQLLKELTLEEKAKLCSGEGYWETKAIERVGVPSVTLSDGPHGVRKEREDDDNIAMKSSYPSTCFPSASCSASSWNKDNLYKMGETIADQCLEQGVTTILGPGINLKRSALCGRNFEYFSEDPLVSGVLATAYIKGAQSKGIATSLKHFAANNQEYLRMSINSVIDTRALFETYLRAFEYTVKNSNPTTVMCSYNKINGIYSAENYELLTTILRKKWGWDGVVVSDWGATNNRVAGVKAGMDLEMPYFGKYNDNSIVKAVKKGRLTMDELDTCVRRNINYALTAAENKEKVGEYFADYDEGHQVARRIAADSMVLLKNDENVFPFSKKDKVTVIGEFAKDFRYQGSGSSRINPYKLTNFIEVLDKCDAEYEFCPGYEMKGDGYNKKLIEDAVAAAGKTDKVLVFVGLTESYESEGYDRSDISIPNGHVALLNEISKVNSNIAVVLLGGSAIEMPWLNITKGVLNAFLSGEAGSEAIYDIVFGDVCPSGKLAETYPLSIEDNLADKYFRGGPKTVEYRESVFIGYKYYDSAAKKVLFPFGYGLSYTNFTYSDMTVDKKTLTDKDKLTVSVKIKNTGAVYGGEVVQVYVKDTISTAFRPEKELVGFEKVYLNAGESKTVTIVLDKMAFSFYNVGVEDWYVEDGEFQILVGASSRDIKFTEKVNVTNTGKKTAIIDYRKTAPSYFSLNLVKEIPNAEFETLYGKAMPVNKKVKRGHFDTSSTMDDIHTTIIGKVVGYFAPKVMVSQVKDMDMTTVLAMQQSFKEIPIRSLCGMSTGLVSYDLILGIVRFANFRWFSGIYLMLKGVIKSISNLATRKAENFNKGQKEKQANKEREEKRKSLLADKSAKKTDKDNKKAEKSEKREEKQTAKLEKKEEKLEKKEEKQASKQDKN